MQYLLTWEVMYFIFTFFGNYLSFPTMNMNYLPNKVNIPLVKLIYLFILHMYPLLRITVFLVYSEKSSIQEMI